MKVYLDVCCLNRPFDDLTQRRVRQEAQAVQDILQSVDKGRLELAGSPDDADRTEGDRRPGTSA